MLAKWRQFGHGGDCAFLGVLPGKRVQSHPFMPHRTLSLEQAAAYLHLRKEDVFALVRAGDIPHDGSGDRIVFKQIELDSWASRRILSAGGARLKELHKQSFAKKHDLSESSTILAELLSVSSIEANFAVRTKSSVLRGMVALAEKTELVNYPDDLLSSLENRERLASTALGGGVALLHPQHHEPYQFEDSFVVFARATQEIPFGAPDGLQTRHFFLICGQDDRIHLHVLARICMMCYHTSVLADIEDAETADDIHRALLASEREVIEKHSSP